jgi:hypothetical protein
LPSRHASPPIAGPFSHCWSANATQARWEKTFCLVNNPFHYLTSLRDVIDQRASLAGNHPSYVEISAFTRCDIVLFDLFRCCFQRLLMT